MVFIGHARRDLERLPRDLQQRVAAAIRALADNPRPAPPAGKPLTGDQAGLWRVRVGGWRVIYRIDDSARVVAVVDIMPRQDDYRPL
ncbi:MAG: type II toxin-antitoxin system RelE/ParE family toxin [Armatimonadetes bacterium]|nr:type II toxin-antitoxin system RelE/ParE family toxin [Armatimonadota bacterium]